MEPTTALIRGTGSSVSSAVGRAGARDGELRRAARLLLLDLDTVDASLERALTENSRRHLGEGITSKRWPELQDAFARHYSRGQQDDWETLVALFETRGFLEWKHVEALGQDSPLDVRERGWVWFAWASHVPLRRDMNVLATTTWWHRLLRSTPPKTEAANVRLASPPLPPDVREAVDRIDEKVAPTDHWGLPMLAHAVRAVLRMELSEDEREVVAGRLERRA
jgi:hypothetical protein